MKQNFDYLVSGLSALALMGIAACSDGDGSNQVVPTATTIDVNDTVLAEGDSGSTSFDFTVALSQAQDAVVTVQFSTSDGSAQNESGDADYQSNSGSIAFDPGTTVQVVSVIVNGDQKLEADETFNLVLSSPVGGGVVIGHGQGIGTIMNEEDAAFSIGDLALSETDYSTVAFDFTVSLGAELDVVATVDFATSDGSAQGGAFGGDFQDAAGTLTFDPGVTQQTVSIQAFGDFDSELDETFTVDLSNPLGAGSTLADAQGLGTIADDDTEIHVDGDPLSASWRPQIAASGPSLYAAWFDERDGLSDVYFRSSTDGGSTWHESALRLDTDAPGAAASTGVRICADEDAVYAVWEDARNGAADVYFSYSADAGATWLPADVRLDTDAPGAAASTQVQVAGEGGQVYVAWIDSRNGGGDVYFNYSHDGGDTWQLNDLRLDSGASGSTASSEPRITAAGDQINVVWVEDGDICSNYSLDGGATWQPAHIRVDTDPTSPNVAGAPRVAADGNNVYVVWQDERNGAADIYYNESFDGGATFAPSDQRLDTGDLPGANSSTSPEICAEDFDVYVVWQDHRQADQSFDDIYFNRSDDGGVTWHGDERLDFGDTAGKSQSQTPVIACEGQTLAVAWSDLRNGPELDLFATTSVDGGESFRSRPWRLDSDAPGSAASAHAQMIVHEGRALVVWEDQRFGGDVYFRSFDPH